MASLDMANTSSVSSCILCGANDVSFALHQQEQIIFFAKLLKNALHPDGDFGQDIANIISLVPSLYVFCSTCYNKVVQAKESFDALTKLQRSLRQAQVEVQAQILSSYYSSISNSFGSTYIDKVRADLVQRLIFNLTSNERDKPSFSVQVPQQEEQPSPFLFLDEESFHDDDDDDLHFPISDPMDVDVVHGDQHQTKVLEPSSSTSTSLLVSEANYHRQLENRKDKKLNIEKKKKSATETYVTRKCTVNLGDRVVPLKCVNSECQAKFWTEESLRRHLKTHRKRDEGRRVVTVKRVGDRRHGRRVGSTTVKRVRRKKGIRPGPKSVLMTLFDKSNTVSYPTKCPLEYCESKRSFVTRDHLRTHIKRIHWDLDPRPPKRTPEGVTQAEIDIMISLYTRPLPSQCPLPDCWLDQTYETLQALQGHVRQHCRAMKLYGEEEPAAMRRDLYKAHFLEYPLTCFLQNCRSDTSFKSRELYRRHIRDVHYKTRSNKALHFDEQNNLFQILQGHFRRVKELNFPAKCFIKGCENETLFGGEYELRYHIKNVHFKDVLNVANQQAPEVKKIRLIQMLDTVQSYPVKCPVENCEDTEDFTSRVTLRRHLQVHAEDDSCNFDDKSMDAELPKQNVQQQIDQEIQDAEAQEKNLTSADEPPPTTSNVNFEHKCNQCNRQFHTYMSLRHHKAQVHKVRRTGNLDCKDCGKTFANIHTLRNHNEVHHSGKPAAFLCSFCPKTFKLEAYLKTHVRRHTGDYKYFCGCCPRGFLLRTELEEHERGVHWEELGIEPIKCDICGKVFRRGGVLQTHKKSHDPSQAFCCQECDYKTGLKNDLREHVVTVHRTETPFACGTCGKAFKLERRLRQHQRSHDAYYPHQCVPCGRHFASARQHRVHKERKHGAAPSTAPRGILVEEI